MYTDVYIVFRSVHIAYRHKIKKSSWQKERPDRGHIGRSWSECPVVYFRQYNILYRYRWNGKAAQLTIGDYPTTSLSQARERRQQFRAWLTEGLDPRRQTVLEKQKKVEALTVKEAFDYWEKYYCIPEGLVKIKVNRRDFNNHIAPVLGNMIVDQTTKAHWLNLFDGMGRRVVTGQMLGLMQRTFRFCSNRGVINVNPIESLRRSDVGLTASVKDRRLSDEEIKQFGTSFLK